MFISFQPMICTGASCLVFICIAVFVLCILLCCYFSSVYLINAKECFYRCPRVRVQDSSRDHPKVTLFPYSCSIKGMEFSFPIDFVSRELPVISSYMCWISVYKEDIA